MNKVLFGRVSLYDINTRKINFYVIRYDLLIGVIEG